MIDDIREIEAQNDILKQATIDIMDAVTQLERIQEILKLKEEEIVEVENVLERKRASIEREADDANTNALKEALGYLTGAIGLIENQISSLKSTEEFHKEYYGEKDEGEPK